MLDGPFGIAAGRVVSPLGQAVGVVGIVIHFPAITKAKRPCRLQKIIVD